MKEKYVITHPPNPIQIILRIGLETLFLYFELQIQPIQKFELVKKKKTPTQSIYTLTFHFSIFQGVKFLKQTNTSKIKLRAPVPPILITWMLTYSEQNKRFIGPTKYSGKHFLIMQAPQWRRKSRLFFFFSFKFLCR